MPNNLTPKKPAVALDVAGTLKNMGELVVRRAVEPALGGVKLWDKGLGDVVGEMVDQCNLPASISAVDVARSLGLVKPKRGGRR